MLKKSITLKIFGILFFGILLIIIVSGFVTYQYENSLLLSQLENESEITMDRLAFNLTLPLWNFDRPQYQSIIELEQKNEIINTVLIYTIMNQNTNFLIGVGKNSDQISYLIKDTNDIEFYTKNYFKKKIKPVVHEEMNIAVVEVYFSDKKLTESRNLALIKIAVQIVALLMFIIIVVFFSLNRIVLHPIMSLSETVSAFAKKDFSARISLKSEDEIGKLAADFNNMANTIQEYNEHLEDLVEKRTAEVQTLLEQQNGDYFLTSLLVQPLIQQSEDTENVHINFIVEQKKKFHFKKWDAEIGGDLCNSDTITLMGKDYRVFINADAMGKSMQGAGGALTLGVVFSNYVNSTKNNRMYDKTPREWLLDFYYEAQSIFETFEGSMLISAIVGLIDEETGILYYFNQEHPWMILYRNSKAVFAENETYVGKKIGTIGFSQVHIQTLQLEENDIILMGSDGKDDIKFGMDDQTGQRIINEDENLILSIVEEANASLDKIREIILQKGELTDDLSLLRIQFTGDYNPIHIKTTQETGLQYLKKATDYYKKYKYELAEIVVEDMLNLNLKDDLKAKGLNIKGLIYYKIQKYEKSLEYLKKASELSPENKEIKNNIDIVQRKI